MTERLGRGIYRIIIPFEKIYTTSFVLTEENDAIVYDFGCSDWDCETYVIPALEELGVNVRYLAVSHAHCDHCGGIEIMRKTYPNAQIIYNGELWGCTPSRDGDILLGRYKLIHLKGHSDDGLAIFDVGSKLFISGDALQSWGVDRFKTDLSDYGTYIEALGRVGSLGADMIVASHEYEPFGSIVSGAACVLELLNECKKAADLKCGILRTEENTQ